jgi:hypothetical protein
MIDIPNDTITADKLSVDLRRRLIGEGGLTSLITEQEVRSILEIPVCGVVSTSNITLSGEQTIDGISTSLYELILVAGQTDKKDNGVYILSAGTWEIWQGMTAGQLCLILDGTVNKNTIWKNTNNIIEAGVTNIEYELLEFGGGLVDGTVDNSTLRWNGTAWVETTRHRALVDVDSANEYYLYSNNSNLYVRLRTTDTSNVLLLFRSSTKFIEITTGGFATNIYLRDGTGNDLQFYPATASSLKCINLRNNSIERFLVYGDGKIFSNILTANTVLLANASKEIVSLENSTDGKVLKLVSGAPAWADESGGGGIDDGTIEDSTLRWDSTKWAESLGLLVTKYEDDYNAKVDVKVQGHSSNEYGADFIVKRYNNDVDPIFHVSSLHSRIYAYYDFRLPHRSGVGNRFAGYDVNGSLIEMTLPSIPTDISDLSDDDDLLFSGDYDDLDNKPNIPYNRHSFSTVDTIYLNKDDGETDLVQVTGLQVSLAQGKRYAIEIGLYNLSSSDSRLTFFLDGDESWDLSSVFVAETNKLQNGLVLNDILDVNFRTEYELQTPDSNSRTVLRINGHIDTNTESGILKVLCRCSETGNTDFTRNVTILKNSYIRAIESSIN